MDLKLAGGHPYSWVQELCGLGFLPGLTQPQHRHIGDVIDAIRKRADSLVSLKSQVDHLRQFLFFFFFFFLMFPSIIFFYAVGTISSSIFSLNRETRHPSPHLRDN